MGNPITSFLEGYDKRNTLLNYEGRLRLFFKAVGVDPTIYFKKNRNYNADILKFIQYSKDYSPITIKTTLNTVKIFFEENGMDFKKVLSPKTLRLLKKNKKRAKPITRDLISTPQELKKILQYGTLKDRALFLFLISSGCRIDEALNLSENDIDMTKEPIKVEIPADITKSDEARVTFISNETRDCLIEWKKQKPRYLHSAVGKSIRYKKSIKNPRIFPFTYTTALHMWHRLLEQSGFNEKDSGTDRYKRHIHTLRKFFRVYLSPKASADITEILMGHQDSLGNVYRRFSDDQLAKAYLKAMPDISIYESVDLTEFKESLKEKDDKIKNLEYDLQKLESEIKKMRHNEPDGLIQLVYENLKNERFGGDSEKLDKAIEEKEKLLNR